MNQYINPSTSSEVDRYNTNQISIFSETPNGIMQTDSSMASTHNTPVNKVTMNIHEKENNK
jgi:hypothetical protein